MAFASVFRVSQVLRVLRLSAEPLSCKSGGPRLKGAGLWSCQQARLLGTLDDKKPKLPPADTAKEPKKKKGLKSPQITLIMPDERVMMETLEQAEKLAKRRDLKLIKIVDFDPKTERPLYQLMSNLQLFQEQGKAKIEKNPKSSQAHQKLFIISSKIAENDLDVKLRQMHKLLKKQLEIRVFISQDGNPARADKVVELIESSLKERADKKNQVKKATTLKLLFVPKPIQEGEISALSDNRSGKNDDPGNGDESTPDAVKQDAAATAVK